MITIRQEEHWYEDADLSLFIQDQAANGTLFHRPSFLEYHDDSKFENRKKIQFRFFKHNKLIGYINGVVDTSVESSVFISPFGASYGGLIYSSDLDYKEIETIAELLLTELSQKVNRIKLSTTCQFHSRNGTGAYLDYILLRYGFTITKSDMPLVHEVRDTEQLTGRLDKKTATELKQPLQKNPLKSEIIDGIDKESYNLLLDSQARLSSFPTHTFDELLKIEELLPGTIKTLKTTLNGNLLSAITTMRVSDRVLNTFYIYDSIEGRPVKANHFSYYMVLKYAFENNYKYVDFGPSTFGWTPNYPLIAFKEKFDTIPYLRHTFEKEVAPDDSQH